MLRKSSLFFYCRNKMNDLYNFNEIIVKINVQPHDLYLNVYEGFAFRFSIMKWKRFKKKFY